MVQDLSPPTKMPVNNYTKPTHWIYSKLVSVDRREKLLMFFFQEDLSSEVLVQTVTGHCLVCECACPPVVEIHVHKIQQRWTTKLLILHKHVMHNVEQRSAQRHHKAIKSFVKHYLKGFLSCSRVCNRSLVFKLLPDFRCCMRTVGRAEI